MTTNETTAKRWRRLAAMTSTLLRPMIALRAALVKASRVETLDTCSRCHRDLAGDYLIWLEHVWCLDCFDRARGGTVVKTVPVEGECYLTPGVAAASSHRPAGAELN